MNRTGLLIVAGLLVAAWGLTAVRAEEPADEVRILRAQNALLKATIETRDKTIAELQEEIKRLKAEISGVQAGEPDSQPASTTDTNRQEAVTGNAVIGLVVKGLDADIRTAFREDGIPIPMPPGGGLFVSATAAGSPAQRAGISPMNVIVIRNGRTVLRTPEEFQQWAAGLEVGQAVNVLQLRLDTDMGGRWIWKRHNVEVVPVSRQQFEDDRLRRSYLRIDDEWLKLPCFDLAKPSSWSGRHREVRGRFYRSRDGTTMYTSDPSRRPAGAVDVTAEVVANKRSDREAMLPKVEVGEFGKVKSCRVSQVLGNADMIVEIGLDDLGWTRIGVPDRYESVRIAGLSTKDVVEDRRYSFESPIAIIGTWAYTTVTGAKRTIYLAVPVERIRTGLSDAELVRLKRDLPDMK